MLNRRIRQNDPVFQLELALFGHGSGDRLLDRRPVLGMDRRDEHCVGGLRCRRIMTEKAKVLCRPAHLSRFDVPVPAAGLADLLRLDEEGFALPEILLGLFPFGNIDREPGVQC